MSKRHSVAWSYRAASTVPSAASSIVHSAVAADLAFVVMLQKAHAAALGFLPRQALEEKIRLGQVLLARAGDTPLGFLHHGSLARPEVRVFQIAVRPQVRAQGIGRALVESLVARTAAAGAWGISLRCLSFLDANRFWRAAEFRLHAMEPGAKGTLNVWVRRLRGGAPGSTREHPGRFTFSSRLHPCPGCGRATVDTWVRGARRLTLCPGCVAAAAMN